MYGHKNMHSYELVMCAVDAIFYAIENLVSCGCFLSYFTHSYLDRNVGKVFTF